MQPTVAQPVNTSNRSWSDVQDFLISRVGLLEGVVFSGGEPLMHSELPAWIDWCKCHGFGVGLHTSGVLPEALERVLPGLDWVGLDFKAPFSKYSGLCTLTNADTAVKTSLEIVIDSEIPYEIRTVYDQELLDSADIAEMRSVLLAIGATHWTIKPRLFV